jgi:glycosyltransferase involved in cell wall biosynthesis
VSGCTVIVDSSKHPSLAFCLRRSAELDLRVIHVVRDSRAVAYSWSRKLMRPDTAMPTYMATPTPAASAWQWDYQNAAMLLLARSGTPTYRVRYEDFVMAPEATLARIAAFAGLSVAVNEIGFLGSDAGGRWADLTTSHTASGNPMRFTTGRIRIRPDEVWRTSMSASQRRTVTAITLPLLVHYRYSSRGRPELEASRVREWPSVGVILPAHDRPAQLRTALAAVLTQDYPGRLEAVVVYDRAEPDHSLADSEQVQVLVNARTPGLAGARNTGVLALDTDLIAFCDDDDEWLPGKLRAQVAALQDRPAAELASCGIVVEFGGRSSPRLVGRGEVTHDDLLRSRMVMVHSSTYLVRRGPLLDHIGLIDETIPESQSEDWDLALRAARRHPIVFVDRPLVRVTWGDASHFSQQWEARAESLLWMLRRHPGIAGSDAGAARVYGQLAFANACLGRRGDAWLWSRRAVRSNWHERRVPFALAVSVGLVSGDTVMRLLHSRGYGI